MLIDWFTVAAQAVNFLILVWLMKRFLLKPVTTAIDAREKNIAAELAGADAKKAEAEKERADFEAKNKDLADQRSTLLAKAETDAKAERTRLFDEARKDADGLRARQATALQDDQKRLSGEITRMAAGQVFDIARKALADLATVSLEERVGEVFTRRLRELPAAAKESLGAALKTSSEPALVRSAFELPTEQKAAIQNALNETFHAAVSIQFQTKPDEISGIELTANGQKLGWSIDGYLKSLDEKIGDLLNAQSSTPAKAPAKSDAKSAQKPSGGAAVLKSAASPVAE
jgi:F-type H+-transporting ATPase subunit b